MAATKRPARAKTPPMPDSVAPLLGTYRSSQDACTRRVFWHAGQLMQARCCPGREEEPPFAVTESDVRRLIAFFLFIRL